MLQNIQTFPEMRMRRLREKDYLRELVQETHLSARQFVMPLFIRETGEKKAIPSMPGHYQLTLKDLPYEIEELVRLGIPAVLLFGIPATKDAIGSSSWSSDGIIQKAIREIKKQFPQMLVIADSCFCDYTDHCHCGVMQHNSLDNDATLSNLQKQAISYAEAGADVIAPSGMIDGMVGAIRKALDRQGFTSLPILSYSAKYASALYAPFRDAAESIPKFGDRKSYQMDPANGAEALREVALDLAEGADMVMVKPAIHFLDIIYRVRTEFPGVPLAAYHVSGEYAMIKAAASKGWIDEKKVALEQLLSIRRAGANFIIHYFCKDAAIWLQG